MNSICIYMHELIDDLNMHLHACTQYAFKCMNASTLQYRSIHDTHTSTWMLLLRGANSTFIRITHDSLERRSALSVPMGSVRSVI